MTAIAADAPVVALPGQRPVPRVVADRDHLARRYIAGEQMSDMAVEYGVSRERVRQVICEARPDYRRQRHDREAADAAAYAAASPQRIARAATLLAEHGTLAKDDLIAKLGEPLSDVELRHPDIARRLVRLVDWGNKGRSRDQMLDGIRWAAAAADDTDPFCSRVYETLRVAHPERRLVSAMRLIQVFDTWTAACALAGVSTRRAVRSTYPRRWGRAAALRHVRRYLDLPDTGGSFVGYDRWALTDSDAPSSGTVRNLLRPFTWNEIKHAALQIDQPESETS